MSIYALPTRDEELSSWVEKTQHAGTQQHAAIANVVGDQFGNQDIRIPFLVAGNRWWLPAKSYVRMRVRVTNGNMTGPPSGDPAYSKIAPTMGFCASLFQSAEFAIRGVTVSRLTDFVPQADQYWKRTQKSHTWMKTVGESMDYEEMSFDERSAYWTNQYDGSGFVKTHYATLADRFNLAAGSGIGLRPQLRMRFVYVQGVTAPIPAPSTGEILTVSPGTYTVALTVAGTGAAGPTLYPGERVFIERGSRVQLSAVGAVVPMNATFSFTITGVSDPVTGTYYADVDMSGLAACLVPGAVWDGDQAISVYIPGDTLPGTNGYAGVTLEHDEKVHIEPSDGQAFEVCWQPPLSVFGLNHALPSMSCELILKARPNVNYSIAGISTRPATYTAPAAPPRNVAYNLDDPGNVRLYVDNLYFYSYQMESDRLDDGTFMLDLAELGVTTANLQRGNASMQQLNLLIPPSTYQVGVAFQDSRVGTSTRWPFTDLGYHQSASQQAGVFPGQAIESEQVLYNGTDLNRLYLQYGNRTFPQPDAQPVFIIKGNAPGSNPNGVSYLTQRWLESVMATGQYWAPGGPEPFKEWLTKGPLYIFPTLRDPTDRSTNLVVNCQFQNSPPAVNCFVFTMSRKVATIRVANGAVQEVDVQDQ